MMSRRASSGSSWGRLLISRSLVLGVVGIGLAGCATRQATESLQKQIAALQAENFNLRKDLTEARVRLEMLKEGPSQTGSTPAGSQPAAAGRAAGNAVVTPSKAEAPRVIYSEPITDASRFTTGAGAGASTPPGRLMKSARERLDAKDPTGAMSLFQQIVTRYPDDGLADDAQFGIGECYFQMGKYEEAISEYQRVVSAFPFGDQVPSAFLKIGFAHLAREQRALALDNFKTVSEAYPGTEAATVARQQIAHLSRQSTEAAGHKSAPAKP